MPERTGNRPTCTCSGQRFGSSESPSLISNAFARNFDEDAFKKLVLKISFFEGQDVKVS